MGKQRRKRHPNVGRPEPVDTAALAWSLVERRLRGPHILDSGSNRPRRPLWDDE